VVVFLQTRDPAIFPFTQQFDDARHRAFAHDLREALADLQDSGSARKTAATGYIMRDRRLREVIEEWAAAAGSWPEGADPRDAETALGASSDIDTPYPGAGLRP
jgi:hypothetical protein